MGQRSPPHSELLKCAHFRDAVLCQQKMLGKQHLAIWAQAMPHIALYERLFSHFHKNVSISSVALWGHAPCVALLGWVEPIFQIHFPVHAQMRFAINN